ncbi:FtsX-like permease family protein [Streptococcus constellatus]|uniref:FtsX-like permease family protein n=1 Tax=Streptococcus TaxID=1301 RepID=UPI0004464C32|nr:MULTISPECIES: FtsX-like permease family protein [Streptococcus]EUB23294.1 MacB-like periplasmic core domain protein [Streptococcus sp. AS20]MBW3452211.1 FtsX-like permease family protein [Streptococcus constellatus]
MKKSILNKDIRLSFRQSKGRFLSIMFLMMLGSFALVGLKAASPDIENSANRYLSQMKMMDVAVMSDYGISKADQKELNAIPNTYVEYGYFTDTVIGDSSASVRVFSKTDKISQFKLVSGHFPSKENQVALASFYQGKYKIGDSITLNEEGTNDYALKQHTFTVTGFVNSSELASTISLGNSNSGSGTLSAYAVVMPKTFQSAVYTVARLRYDDLKTLNSFGDSYRKKVKQHEDELEKLLADNGKKRLSEIKAQAQTKIADGEAKIQTSQQALADAQQQLRNAQDQIDQKRADLEVAQGQLTEKESLLAQGAAQIAQAEQILASSKAKLDTAAAQLSSGWAQLNQIKAQLDQAASQLSAAKENVTNTQATLAIAQAELEKGQVQLAAAKADLQKKMTALQAQGIDPATVPEIVAAQTQLAQEEAKLNLARAELEKKQAEFQAGLSQYQSQETVYQTGLAQYQSAVVTLRAKQAEYDAGLAQYQSGQATLRDKQAEYQAGQAQLAQAKQQIADGQAQLDQAQATLNDKKTEYAKQKKDAGTKIKNGQADIRKAKDEVASLSVPTYRVYTRRTFPGADEYTTTGNRAYGISAVGNAFPIVLYLVAALVTVTTMTRFVSEERTNAGVLKALGYRNQDVVKKFAVYGLVSSLIGSVIGILAGTYFLPYILGKTIFKTSTYPALRLDFYWEISLIALLCSVLCGVAPALYIAHKELKEKPSQLLLPKAPTKGSKILLERIDFIWRRLSFTQKVTARNIFRYKQRMLMTIFGVAGSVALLFAGLGMSSSMEGMGNRQYGEIIKYDAVISQKQHLKLDEQAAINHLLADKKIAKKRGIYQEIFTKKIKGAKDEQSLALFVTTGKDFHHFIELYDSQSKASLNLSSHGAVISQKLATIMHVSVGDTFEVTSDEGKRYKIKVSGIAEMYAGHFIFMNQDYYQTVFARKFQENAYLIKLKDSSSKNVQDTAAAFMKLTGVRAVVQNTGILEQIDVIVKSLGFVMQILTVASILLAIVILYNLMNINVAERIRELSTIKVLGFHNKEVTLYIYRETILLSVIGIIVGLFLGNILHRSLLETIAPDAFLLNPAVSVFVYLVPVFSIIMILIVLGFMVNAILRRIDMLEALKSVD